MELFRCLIGSQNYGLSDETSDKDYYVYHIPSFEDVYHNKLLVREEKTDEGILFHKDIRSLSNMITKSSFNQLEVLFSCSINYNGYTWGNLHNLIINFKNFLEINGEFIARANMNRLFASVCGEIKRRINDLQKGKYTANTEHLFKQHGYDTKNAMHAVRLINLWVMIYNKIPLQTAFKIDTFLYKDNFNINYLEIKKGRLNLSNVLYMLGYLEEKHLIPFFNLNLDFTDHSIDTNNLLNEMNTYIFNIVRENINGN